MVDNRFLDHQHFGSMICVIFASRDESLSPMEQDDHLLPRVGCCELMMSMHCLVDPNISVISRKEIIFHDHFGLPVRIRFPQVQPG